MYISVGSLFLGQLSWTKSPNVWTHRMSLVGRASSIAYPTIDAQALDTSSCLSCPSLGLLRWSSALALLSWLMWSRKCIRCTCYILCYIIILNRLILYSDYNDSMWLRSRQEAEVHLGCSLSLCNADPAAWKRFGTAAGTAVAGAEQRWMLATLDVGKSLQNVGRCKMI